MTKVVTEAEAKLLDVLRGVSYGDVTITKFDGGIKAVRVSTTLDPAEFRDPRVK